MSKLMRGKRIIIDENLILLNRKTLINNNNMYVLTKYIFRIVKVVSIRLIYIFNIYIFVLEINILPWVILYYTADCE